MRWADQAYGIKFVVLRYFNVAELPSPTDRRDHGQKPISLPLCSRLAQGKREERLPFLETITILQTEPMSAIMSSFRLG